MKTCNKCGAEKPLNEYHKNAAKRDGHCEACKTCRRKSERERYIKRPITKLTQEQIAQNKKEWRNLNRDKTRAISKRWNAKNKETLNQASKKYAEANRQKISAKKRDDRRNNPHIPRAQSAGREAAKNRRKPAWAINFFIYEAYDLARRRTKLTGYPWHVDHIVPLRGETVCGLHWEGNLQVIPGSLNCRKNNRHWPDMPNQL